MVLKNVFPLIVKRQVEYSASHHMSSHPCESVCVTQVSTGTQGLCVQPTTVTHTAPAEKGPQINPEHSGEKGETGSFLPAAN